MNHHHHHSLKGKKLAWTIALNMLITLCQTVAGIFSGSLSLLSDALHNFSDVLSLIISSIAERLTQKKFSMDQTFGYKRAEIVAALINASTLLGVAFLICKEAVVRFIHPEEIHSPTVIALAGLSILINALSVLLLQNEAKKSLNIRSAYLHLFSDMLTSIVVMLGGIAIFWLKAYWIDSLLSILIAIYLVYSSWQLVMQTLRVLMQFTPAHLSIKEIETDVLNFEQIQNIHHVHLWQLTDQDIHFEAHLDFYKDLPLSEASKILSEIRKLLASKFKIKHSVLQAEYGVDDPKQLVADHCNLK
ncbi:MAG: cation diffusion facilitator family transporter [Oligoflexales bacterium]